MAAMYALPSSRCPHIFHTIKFLSNLIESWHNCIASPTPALFSPLVQAAAHTPPYARSNPSADTLSHNTTRADSLYTSSRVPAIRNSDTGISSSHPSFYVPAPSPQNSASYPSRLPEHSWSIPLSYRQLRPCMRLQAEGHRS